MVFGRNGDGERSRDPVRRFWELKPIHWVGVVSYGLYLWHFPFMQRVPDHVEPASGISWDGWAGTPPGSTSLIPLLAAGFGLGLLGAAGSYYGLEKPLARFKRLL